MSKYIALIAVLFVSFAALSQESGVSEPIVNRPFTIRPAQFVFYTFNVPSGARNVAVQGRFEASGGGGNDVEVYIVDEDGFVNWQNGHRVRPYYNSGRLTQSNVDARLPAREGNYYLIFSNRFSVVANKAVVAEMTLTYN